MAHNQIISYTSSFKSMRRFILHIILALLPCLFMYIYYRLSIDSKPKGDLSRMSYIEFNYNKPSPTPSDTLGHVCYKHTSELIQSVHKGIVIFGDSFSTKNAGKYWLHHLSQLLCCTVYSISYSGMNSFSEYIKVLQTKPDCLPDTIVVEIVERNLVNSLCEININKKTEILPPLKESPIKNRQTIGGFYQARFLRLNNPCLTAPLSDTLFSDYPTTLFFYKDDTTTYPVTVERNAIRTLVQIDSLSNANGKHLWVLIIPDKLTLYKPYITNYPKIAKRTLETPCYFKDATHLINPLQALRKLTDAGTKDVYLPDDTHISTIGGDVIAREVAKSLKEKLDKLEPCQQQ